jgi:L,D-transpeptidase catalytic domain
MAGCVRRRERHKVCVRRAGTATLTAWLLLCAPVVCSAYGGGAAVNLGISSAATETLSNLHTLSRWAYPQTAAAVHEQPSAGSRVLTHLAFVTSEGQAEPYLALRSSTTGAASWIQLSIPGRPNGRTGWVPASALGEMHTTHEYLRVDREALRAELFRANRAIWQAPVGIGRPSLPTPAGHFFVTEKLSGFADPFYGPYLLGTSAYAPTLTDWPGGGVVGIHGTDEPQLIPGRPSHGCIRLRNGDITSLWRMVEVGTPVEIV